MKVSSWETLTPTQSAQEALDTEPGPDLSLRPLGLPIFPPVLLWRPLACTTHKLPESRFVRGNQKKCPIKSSENCLNSAPNPVVGRESHSAAQLSGHWRAGYALLPCCWCGDLPPVGLKAVGLVRLPLDRTGHRYSPSGFGSGLCTTTGHLRNLPPYFRPSRRNENETLGQWQA